MDYVVLIQVVKGYQNLNCKSFDEVQAKSLEIVHFNELIQVYREHLKCDDQMLAEQKLIESFDDVFLVFWVVVI